MKTERKKKESNLVKGSLRDGVVQDAGELPAPLHYPKRGRERDAALGRVRQVVDDAGGVPLLQVAGGVRGGQLVPDKLHRPFQVPRGRVEAERVAGAKPKGRRREKHA